MAWGTSDQIKGQARLLAYWEDARPPQLADHAVCSRGGLRRRRWQVVVWLTSVVLDK
jgi:hypothetical protein